MTEIMYSRGVKMPPIDPQTNKEETPMLPSQEAGICAGKETPQNITQNGYISPSREADVSPSKQVYVFSSPEAIEVDTSPSEDNICLRENVDISPCEDIDFYPRKKVSISLSEENYIHPSHDGPEVDTCSSEAIDLSSKKKIIFYSSQENSPDVIENDKEKLGLHSSSLECLNKYYYGLLIFAIVICVASTVLTIYVNEKYGDDGKTLQEPTGTSEREFPHGVCVQCIKLVQNPFNHLQADPLMDKLVKRIDDGFQMCCAENEDQMSAMVEAITREQWAKPIPRLDNENSDTGLKYVSVSAHKQMLAGDEREYNVTEPYYGNGSEHFVVRLDPHFNDPLTEHAHGVTVLDNALEVRHSGVYYVYFSVNLAPRPHDRSHSSVEYWSQYVHRTRPNSPTNSGLLLETSHTSCSDCRNHQESAFAGGTFALKKGDLIQVCINGLGLVQFRKESSFLGIILLSNAAT